MKQICLTLNLQMLFRFVLLLFFIYKKFQIIKSLILSNYIKLYILANKKIYHNVRSVGKFCFLLIHADRFKPDSYYRKNIYVYHSFQLISYTQVQSKWQIHNL